MSLKMTDKNNHNIEKKRVAFCGTRGIPANYGGFETAVDEISKRFVINNIECDVLCRASSYHSEHINKIDERNLIYVKGSSKKTFDTIMSSIQTGIYLIRNRKKYDYIFWFNNANFPGILLSKFTGVPIAINTDGLEWRRAKWSLPFKAYYFITSLLICKFFKNLISDSIGIQDYYLRVFNKKTHFIPYGSPEIENYTNEEKQEILERYGLKQDKYFLQITRFEPDNLPLEILNGYKESDLYKLGYKMVLIGYKDPTDYAKKIKSNSNKNGIIVLDAIYDKKILTILRSNCFAYIHGNSVGGTNPALLEAMKNANRIMAINSPFSKEVLGDNGILFDKETLPENFGDLLKLNNQNEQLKKRVNQRYQWDYVAESYIRILNNESPNYPIFNDK
ncbi:DUF1972 domain-containing protein [Bacillus sp. ISL-46]|uniref:DUF1972 domain-containing protein n=1 Tax=Bacillus sp. ISL-46 TaxID=2819129 RepID=UPI001BEA169E|nr:DUF1972 domain-containing protein [Bacillus sp. ISL-46]MBT2724005.1 DUF1972 domain-containing protein [Bacillus sp. ISL-46]